MSKIKIEIEVDACDLCNKELGMAQIPMEIIDIDSDDEVAYYCHVNRGIKRLSMR